MVFYFMKYLSLPLPPPLFEALKRNAAFFIFSFHYEKPKSKPLSDLAATLLYNVSKMKCNKR